MFLAGIKKSPHKGCLPWGLCPKLEGYNGVETLHTISGEFVRLGEPWMQTVENHARHLRIAREALLQSVTRSPSCANRALDDSRAA